MTDQAWAQSWARKDDMNKMKLVVNVDAKFSWLEPPKSMEEQIMREQADIMAKTTAHKLNQVVQLLVLELLNQVPNA